jgi:hypothetical protein
MLDILFGSEIELVPMPSPEQEQGSHQQQYLRYYFRPKQEIATATLDVASDGADGEKLVVPKNRSGRRFSSVNVRYLGILRTKPLVCLP